VKTNRIKIPAHISTSYECEKCGRKYPSESRARKCESQPLEARKFKRKDLVSWREIKNCSTGRKYFIKGTVWDIVGPVLPDEEYNIKWLKGRLSGKHVYEYIVEWNCPFCMRNHEDRFYGPELIKVTKDMPFTNCRKMEQFMRRKGMYKSPR
jgi:hypothetical protein